MDQKKTIGTENGDGGATTDGKTLTAIGASIRPTFAFRKIHSALTDRRSAAKRIVKSTHRRILEQLLLFLTAVAIACGVLLGIVLNTTLTSSPWLTPGTPERDLLFDYHPGHAYIKLLKTMVFPMVLGSNVSNMVTLSTRAARITGLWTLAYFSIATLVAEAVAIVVTVIIKPGTTITDDVLRSKFNGTSWQSLETALNVLRFAVPENIVKATFSMERTAAQEETLGFEKSIREAELLLATSGDDESNSNTSIHKALNDLQQGLESNYYNATNVIGLIFFSIMFGIGLRALGEEVAMLSSVFFSLRRVLVHLVSSLIVWLAPVGILFIIAEQVAKMKDVSATLDAFFWLCATEIFAIGIHAFGILSLILFTTTRQKNPIRFMANMGHALLTAVGTASSMATLPITLECLEDRIQVNSNVARFVVPLGSALNMQGTAMHLCITAVFFAQMDDLTLKLSDYIIIMATAFLAQIATPTMPGGSLLTAPMVLQAIGIPTKNRHTLWPIDWFLDRLRTPVNVHGTAVGVAVVARFCGKSLENTTPLPDMFSRMMVESPLEEDVLNVIRESPPPPPKRPKIWRYYRRGKYNPSQWAILHKTTPTNSAGKYRMRHLT